MRNTIPPLPHPPNGNDPNTILVHQEDIIRRERAELLAELLSIATDGGEAPVD